MLNWRRDPGLEKKIEESRMREQQLKQLNARGRELLSSAALLCLAPESSSIPPNSTLLDQLGPE
jgi:hypothetical protein